MSISPAFHGWSSGYLKPAFLGWERHEAIASNTAAGRLVHHGRLISTCAHAGSIARLAHQSRHVSGISPMAASHQIATHAGCPKAVSSGDNPVKAVRGKMALKISAPLDTAAISIKEGRVPLVCNGVDSTSKAVRDSGDAHPAVTR